MPTRTGGKPGNPRKPRRRIETERVPRLVDAAQLEDVQIPDGLGPDGERAYREVLGVVVAAGCTDPLTLARVADLAHATDLAAKARRIIAARGLTVLGSKRNRIANPAVAVERESTRTVETLRRAIRAEVDVAGHGEDVEGYLRRVGYFGARG